MMKVSASARFIRISPSKVRPFARRLSGLSLEQAMTAARFSPQKGAFYIGKLLKSMAANLAAGKLNGEDFFVSKVAVEKGPVLKRFWPRSRGMVSPVLKRMSHLKIVLVDKAEKKGKE